MKIELFCWFLAPSAYFDFISRLLKHCEFRKLSLVVFCKKGVLKNLAKFPGRRLCWVLPFNKVAGLRLQHRCFPGNFAKFLRTPFLQNTSGRLLLRIKVTLTHSMFPVEKSNLIKRFYHLVIYHVYPKQTSKKPFTRHGSSVIEKKLK